MIQAEGWNEAAKDFCHTHHMSRLQSFALSLYTEPVASSLALYWCHKMQALFTMWYLSGDEDYVFSAEEVAMANEWDLFDEELGGLAANSPGRRRTTLIQQIVPRL